MAGPLLELTDVDAFYGNVQALRSVSLTVGERESVAILGPNGAGKTTLLRAISRMVRTDGDIVFMGRSVVKTSTSAISDIGIGHVPEGRGTFVDLTVAENLELGLLGRRREKSSKATDLERVYDTFPILSDFRRRVAGSLSGGQQQLLALMRALLARPTLLMIDEPSVGLAPIVTAEVFELLRNVREEWDLAMLLAEQNVHRALAVANRGYVLSSGSLVFGGSAEELRELPELTEAYLGSSEPIPEVSP